MPTINRKYRYNPRPISDSKTKRVSIYQSKMWKQLRKAYIMNHPLCEICLVKGITTPAEDVHHIDSFMNYDGEQQIQKAYDYNNLLSLCKTHHQLIHNSKEFKQDESYTTTIKNKKLPTMKHNPLEIIF